jgi:formylglycine-generating enzyme required for sulfatase activity
MHGNAWEWCVDWYDKDYYRNSPKKDPQGPEKNPQGPEKDPFRVVRGGCWNWDGWLCRAACRFSHRPAVANKLIGFRVVCVPADRTP